MHRICGSMTALGYQVTLVGRKRKHSAPLTATSFQQKRLWCGFDKGFAFYATYNLRLFFYLLFTRADAYCAIDLDTILPNYFASVIRQRKRLYDAHELFTEQKEIVTRPLVHKIWLGVERFAVPRFTHGYTVNTFIQEEFKRRYGVTYGIIRNMPLSTTLPNVAKAPEPFIIYQGAVNEGRSFETLIPAMQQVNCKLVICGEGNFFEQAQQLVQQYQLQHKVILRGYVAPAELKQLTPTALFGLTLFEKTGLNQYYSLSNRFFDYVMAGIPQVCVNYPEYKAINDDYHFAYMVNDTDVQTLADALNKLLQDAVLYNRLQQNSKLAALQLNWEQEEKKLAAIWQKALQ